jgi:hypothetical protein
VKQPEATDRHSGAERGHEGKNDLNGELAVLHSDFLAKPFDLYGHEVNPETLFLIVSRHERRHARSSVILQVGPLTGPGARAPVQTGKGSSVNRRALRGLKALSLETIGQDAASIRLPLASGIFSKARFFSLVVRAGGEDSGRRGQGGIATLVINLGVNFMRVRSLLSQKAMLGALALGGALMASASAFAQAAGGTIGAQIGTMAQEFSTAGGTAASSAMYVGALITFVAGAWFLWQSRQPENREAGKVAAGAAGLVLTGLLVTGGAWINKAAETATGTAASISSTAGVVTFP